MARNYKTKALLALAAASLGIGACTFPGAVGGILPEREEEVAAVATAVDAIPDYSMPTAPGFPTAVPTPAPVAPTLEDLIISLNGTPCDTMQEETVYLPTCEVNPQDTLSISARITDDINGIVEFLLTERQYEPGQQVSLSQTVPADLQSVDIPLTIAGNDGGRAAYTVRIIPGGEWPLAFSGVLKDKQAFLDYLANPENPTLLGIWGNNNWPYSGEWGYLEGVEKQLGVEFQIVKVSNGLEKGGALWTDALQHIYDADKILWLVINPVYWDPQNPEDISIPNILADKDGVQSRYMRALRDLYTLASRNDSIAIVSVANEPNGNWYPQSFVNYGGGSDSDSNGIPDGPQRIAELHALISGMIDEMGASDHIILASDYNGTSHPNAPWNQPSPIWAEGIELMSYHEYPKTRGDTIAARVNDRIDSYANLGLPVAIGETACADTTEAATCYGSLTELDPRARLVMFFDWSDYWDPNYYGIGNGRLVDYSLTRSEDAAQAAREALQSGKFVTR